MLLHIKLLMTAYSILSSLLIRESRRGHDRMVVGFITTYAISAYHY